MLDGAITPLKCSQKTTYSALLEEAKAGVLKGKYIPKGASMAISEIIHGLKSERTFVAANDDTSTTITNMIKLRSAKDKGDMVDCRCSIEMIRRLNRFLKLKGLKRIVVPRPGRTFSLHFAYYHSALLDPTNVCQWSDSTPLFPDNLLASTYIKLAVSLKANAVTKLKNLGYDPKLRDHINSAVRILKAAQHKSSEIAEMEYYDIQVRECAYKIRAFEEIMDRAMRVLTAGAFKMYTKQGLGTLTFHEHYRQTMQAAFQAFGFEIMVDWYTSEDFTYHGMATLWREYASFLTICSEVSAEDKLLEKEMLLMAKPKFFHATFERLDEDDGRYLGKRRWDVQDDDQEYHPSKSLVRAFGDLKVKESADKSTVKKKKKFRDINSRVSHVKRQTGRNLDAIYEEEGSGHTEVIAETELLNDLSKKNPN